MKTFYLLLIAVCLISAACSPKGSKEAPEAAADEPQTWTCSMHPNIQQKEPGDCPICGMDLIPLVEDSDDLGPREMRMSESAKALADIQSTEIVREYPTAEISLVGLLDYDETRMRSLTARFPARIERLYANYEGIEVDAGEHLAKIYSPELLSAQRELLAAHQNNPDGVIAKAAREKLLLWDLLPQQVDTILESGQGKDHFELLAPIGGVVVDKQIQEGTYVKTGEPMFRIADLSELWLDLRAYESDLNLLRFGQKVDFTVEAFPGEQFEGTISFIKPQVDPKTRTVSVRVNVSNADKRLKPGMLARGKVEARLNAAGRAFIPELAGKWISPMHPEVVKDGPGPCDVCGMELVSAESLGLVDSEDGEAPLLVPDSAVLRTGKRSVVYVENPDAESTRFEGREITLGPKAGKYFIVMSGLEEGERVVTNGAFKIDSALQIQAKPSMMTMNSEAPIEHAESRSMVEDDLLPDLLKPYFDVQKALAADDLETSKVALRNMMKVTGHQGPLPDLIHTMLAAKDLDGIRRPHFETLSIAFIQAVEENKSSLSEPVYRMHCSMVYEDRGADWLQDNDELINPYWGSGMLHCGNQKGPIGGESSANEGPKHEH